jgi:hypothetical protein
MFRFNWGYIARKLEIPNRESLEALRTTADDFATNRLGSNANSGRPRGNEERPLFGIAIASKAASNCRLHCATTAV